MPSYPKQELVFFLLFQFDDLDEFGPKPETVFEATTALFVKKELEEIYPNDIFEVKSFLMYQKKIIATSSVEASSGQRGLSGGGVSDYVRGLQETSGLEVAVDLFVDVRSARTFEEGGMKGDIAKAFDTLTEEIEFIEWLQTQDSATFSRINDVVIQIDNERIIVKEDGGGMPGWAYVAMGAGIGVVAIALIGFFYIRRRRADQNSWNGLEFDEPPDDRPPQPSTLINIQDEEDQDISTLGDPVTGGPTNMYASAVAAYGQVPDEPTNESMLSTGFDFKMAYGGAGYLRSESDKSSVPGNKSLEGTRALADDLSQDESRLRTESVDSSKVSEKGPEFMSMFEEDNSFDRMYGDEEQIDVIAPPGKLGVVIDTPMDGVPMVHAIKDSSVLVDRIRIGDKLVEVDGEDTTEMSAIRVSKLIASKALNPQRHLVFLRSTKPR